MKAPDTFTVELLVRLGNGTDPVSLGTLEIPVTVTSGVTLGEPTMTVTVPAQYPTGDSLPLPPEGPWTPPAPPWPPEDVKVDTDAFNERLAAETALPDIPETTPEDGTTDLPWIEVNEIEAWPMSKWSQKRAALENKGTAKRPLWVDTLTGRQYTAKAALLITGPAKH